MKVDEFSKSKSSEYETYLWTVTVKISVTSSFHSLPFAFFDTWWNFSLKKPWLIENGSTSSHYCTYTFGWVSRTMHLPALFETNHHTNWKTFGSPVMDHLPRFVLFRLLVMLMHSILRRCMQGLYPIEKDSRSQSSVFHLLSTSRILNITVQAVVHYLGRIKNSDVKLPSNHSE